MIIRQAKPEDAQALKTLYFEFLTQYPPKEEQDMSLWSDMLEKFEKDENFSKCYSDSLCTIYRKVQ